MRAPSTAGAKSVVVTGSFDNLRSAHVRFLEEAARLGDLHVLLWSDDVAHSREGRAPRFPFAERRYLVEAIRYVHQVWALEGDLETDALPELARLAPDLWVVDEVDDTAALAGGPLLALPAGFAARGLAYHIVSRAVQGGFPNLPAAEQEPASGRKKVIVTGCYDWLHSGHVRFFEKVSEIGDLYVVVGHDANVRLLKGEGHPMQTADERRYMVHAIRYVKQGLVSSGHGWMDAEPEIDRIRPDYYVVNEDGDKPEKREFCARHGLEYVVLKRTPKEGLTPRTSSDLRGY